MTAYSVNINGIDVKAIYSEENIQNIFIPLLEKISGIQKEKGRRILVMLAAPPGAGKSTLASFLKKLFEEREGNKSIQVIGMDGFHRRQEFLQTHSIIRDGKEVLMVDVKGAPETFDLDKLAERIKTVLSGEKCGWPVYNRHLHNPEDDAITVDSDIVILEGNYLLLNEEGWRDLSEYADYTVFIRAKEDLLRNRLVERRLASGHDREGSERFVEFSDLYNARVVMEKSRDADLILNLNDDGSYTTMRRVPDFRAEGSRIIGNAVFGKECGVWFNAVVRGDEDSIEIGDRTNIQDNCVFHVDKGFPMTIGSDVTVGHGSILHGCQVGDNTLIGMGSTILNGAKIGKNCIIGAGSLVTQNKEIPDGMLAYGNPVKVIRPLTDKEIADNKESAEHYVKLMNGYLKGK